jgi:hypothetical protein
VNVEAAKTRGKIGRNAAIWAASVFFTTTPMNAKTHEKE